MAVTGDVGDMSGRAFTIDSGLGAEQVSENISKTQPMATPNVESSLELNTGGGITSQLTKSGCMDDQARSDAMFSIPKDSPLGAGYTARSDEGSLEPNIELTGS